ncbi:MAG: P27 family phage terminase small subunit [Agarilytica sp.]
MDKKPPKTLSTPHIKHRYPTKDGNVSALPGVDLEDVKAETTHEETAAALIPRGTTAAQKKVWLELGPTLVANNRLSEQSVHAFLEYCDVVVEMAALRKFRKTNNYSYKTTGRHGDQVKTHPEIAQLNTLRTQFMQLCAHFGITPATAARVGTEQKPEESNPFKK